MTDDIVERLRNPVQIYLGQKYDAPTGPIMTEAADEIEHLRREVNLLKEQRTRLARGTEYTTSVENEVERLRSQLAEMEEVNGRANAEIERLVALAITRYNEIEKLRAMLTEAEQQQLSRFRAANDEIVQLRADIEQLMSERQQLDAVVARLYSENEHLRAEVYS